MISVCMATYNGGKYIREQLESILSQLSETDEIIISDDSSTDDTVQIIKSFGDRRIGLIEGCRFHSPIYNFENALIHASGDYIFLSDQDDVWMPNKVKVCLDALQYADFAIHDAVVVDAMKNEIYSSFYAVNHTKKGKWKNLLKNGYLGCCMCFKKDLLKSLLPFPRRLTSHDAFIGNVAAFCHYKMSFLNEKLIKYRRHGNNASPTTEKSTRSILIRILERIYLLVMAVSRQKTQ